MKEFWKKWFSLNLSLLLVLGLFSGLAPVQAAPGQVRYSGNGGKAPDGTAQTAVATDGASNADLQLYGAGAFHKDGAVLSGWQSEDGTLYSPEARIPGSVYDGKTLSLTAQWEKVEGDALIFCANGGKTPTGDTVVVQTAREGEAAIPVEPLFTLEGRTLLGWTDPQGGWYLPGTVLPVTGQLELTAQWGSTFVRYDGNGGRDSRGQDRVSQVLRSTAGKLLGAETFHRSGMEFTGWSTKPQGGVRYSAGQQVGQLGQLTLYAQWETPGSGPVLRAEGTDLLEGFTRRELSGSQTLPRLADTERYAQVGYWAGDRALAPGSAPDGDRQFNLWFLDRDWLLLRKQGAAAVYEAPMCNGDSVALATASAGDLILYGPEQVHQPGSMLMGWAGEGTSYGPYERVPVGTAGGTLLRLRPVWEPVSENQVYYIGGPGHPGPQGELRLEQIVADRSQVSVQDGSFFAKSDPDHAFLGWKDHRGNWYDPGQVADLREVPVLAAQWGLGRITYHGNGGTTSQQEAQLLDRVRYRNYTLRTGDTFTRTYGSFRGWNTNPDGSGTWYQPGDPVEQVVGELALYAQWTEQVPANTVRFSAQAVQSDALLLGAVYDAQGRMLELQPAVAGDGVIWATFSPKAYGAMAEARLFQLDSRTCAPLAPAVAGTK